MYDPDLHLFLTDDEILARDRLQRIVHRLRRVADGPVISPDLP